MKKVIFVCLGNICRSPMAEMMFIDMVNKSGLNEQLDISSMATANYEIGNAPHPGAVAELRKQHIPIISHVAQQISSEDFETADAIIGMDDQNIVDLKKIAPSGTENKIHQAYDVMGIHKEIQDPWFDHKFDRTYTELSEVLPQWMKKLTE
ncbi:low molecular weight protein-tyrosine-phosphatase [Companilactobacillus ginsenosidimutans]|uniref:protein-tyrosine-phosphatase n=1 Tax=Companilactobacillus ginsenosidimutans TaxID=1007676 RepID=A0A0H4QIK1_9LACO|nr:low molecular weight protein-tyrosine-phosphatase [Companilactobacillus ginsenosidimutans]AKP66493.1 protein tyrosine phosphatase [Companilactobacillus ginsenosidimutans]